MKAKRITHATLLYQGPIANVIATQRFATQPKRERLLQGSFSTCEAFARGMEAAGVRIESMYCNQAGDILESDGWDSRLEDAPFYDSFRPIGDQWCGRCGEAGYQLEIAPGNRSLQTVQRSAEILHVL